MEKVGTPKHLPRPEFWKGRRVLLTGHSGFKGTWLSLWLARMGAEVTGLSLPPQSSPNLHVLAEIGDFVQEHWCDLREASGVLSVVREAEPEIVIHLAAQALVRPSYLDPAGTFATNVQGTVNVLEAARTVKSVRVVVAVTTDKVYRNDERGQPFKEDDPLGGGDPYSASKAAAEMVISSYRRSFLGPAGVGVAAARAGNVIGGGDWSADRILPDAVRAWGNGKVLRVRNPASTRPWQHVLEPLAGYLKLAEMLVEKPELDEAFNFGPSAGEVATVRDVVMEARKSFNRGEVEWGATQDDFHEARALALDNSRARVILGIRPVWTWAESVRRTMQWYKRLLDGENARALCEEDINAYCLRKVVGTEETRAEAQRP